MYFLCLVMLLALAHQCIAQEETSTSQTPYETPSFISSQENLPPKEQLCRNFFNEINNKCRMLDETPESAKTSSETKNDTKPISKKAARKEAIKQKLIDIVFEINPQLNTIIKDNKHNDANAQEEDDDDDLRVRALLFTGGPGLGKTLAGQAIAQKLNARFTQIKAADLPTQYQNSASTNLKHALEQIKEPKVPHVLFIDEIHKVMDKKKQEHDKNMDPATTLWQYMDDPAYDHVIFVATANDITNLPEPLKERFQDGTVVFPSLSTEARKKVFEVYIGKYATTGVVEHAAKNTSYKSIRQIDKISRKARSNARDRKSKEISTEDIAKAIKTLQAAIDAGNIPFLSKKNFKENGWAYANLLLDTARVVIGSVQLIKDARTTFTKDNTASTINSSSETDKISTSNQTQTSQTSTAA
ncbi:MAG: ATP-binding protein [Candidatus Dependentiae bacterium]|nr:ATP-binding protein [Candidatus Dependentiae bacterium]